MAWPYLTGIVKTVVTTTIGGDEGINVFYALKRLGESLIPADTQSVAEAYEAAFRAEWPDFAPISASILQIESTAWQFADGRYHTIIPSPAIVGLVADDPLPVNVALVASHRTNFTGRSKRGRSYIMGLCEDQVTDNTVDAATLSSVGDLMTAIFTELASRAFDQVVYSLYENKAPRTEPEATIITSDFIGSRVDTQRRRLPKVQ